MSATLKSKYPLLEVILEIKNLPLQPMYSTRDVAKLFAVSSRAIQSLIASGRISARDLPGRMRFLPQDVENFLDSSKKGELRGH